MLFYDDKIHYEAGSMEYEVESEFYLLPVTTIRVEADISSYLLTFSPGS